jgi:hypothetical protein
VSLLPQEVVAELREKMGGGFDALDEVGRIALVTARTEGGVTHPRLCELTGAHSRDVTLRLHSLVRKELLVSTGGPRTKTYSLDGAPALATVQLALGIPSGSEETSDESSPGSEETSDESSPGSEETSDESSPGSEEKSAGEARGWAPRHKQLEEVLTFCVGQWRTLSEIARAVGRTENTVRTTYLPPLLADGRLERRHPESPRHPHQAYRAVTEGPA